MTELVVIGKNINKTYGSFTAVKDINFTITKGTCFGFLGPNGAGKTTTMRMIHLASSLTSGELNVFGENINTLKNRYEFKKRIGIVHQEDNLDQSLTVKETLEVFCRFYGLHGKSAQDQCYQLLEQVDLVHKQHAIVQTLSGGMRRRLQIARSLIGQPDLVILDEPTTGLDPNIRHELWNQLKTLKRNGITLILTTHYMHEAEQLCDDLVIMNHGSILTQGSPRELVKKNVAAWVIEVIFPRERDLSSEEIITLKSFSDESQLLSDRIFLFTENREELAAQIKKYFPHFDIITRQSSLEDVFIKLTGKKLEAL